MEKDNKKQIYKKRKKPRIAILSNKTGKLIAKEICKDFGLDPEILNIERFNDREILADIKKSIRGSDVFYINPFYPYPEIRLVETELVADAINYSMPKRMISIPTYLGFTRADWKPRSRTSINIRNVAKIFENCGWDYVITFHIHSPQIQGVFRIPFDSFLPIGLFKEDIKEKGYEDFVVVAPDLGGAKYANLFSREVGAKDFAIIYKTRSKPGEAHALNILGDVKDSLVIIVDDIIDTGGSIISAAELCIDKGAKDVLVYSTHGLFSKKIERYYGEKHPDEIRYIETINQNEDDLKEDLENVMLSEYFFNEKIYKIVAKDTGEERFYKVTPAEYKIRKSPIREVVTTNTIPRSDYYLGENSDWYRQVSIVNMLEEIIDRVHNERSVSSLYKQ